MPFVFLTFDIPHLDSKGHNKKRATATCLGIVRDRSIHSICGRRS